MTTGAKVAIGASIVIAIAGLGYWAYSINKKKSEAQKKADDQKKKDKNLQQQQQQVLATNTTTKPFNPFKGIATPSSSLSNSNHGQTPVEETGTIARTQY